MILLKTKKYNTNFSDKIKIYNNGNTNMEIYCPNCNSKNLISHGYYKRTLIYEENGIHIKNYIKIKRVKCKSCGNTHALLPIDIVPYKRVSFSVIIKCLFNNEYFNNSLFSYDTKVSWWKTLKKNLSYIQTIIGFGKNIYREICKSFDDFYINFYKKTNKIILMTRDGCFNIGLL